MKRTYLPALLVVASAGTAAAQATSPTVDQILAKYVQALGGKGAYEKLTSRVTTGTLEAPSEGVTAQVSVFAKAPDKSLIVVETPGGGRLQQGCDGRTAWSDNPLGGVREISGQELSVTRRSAVFHQATKLRELYPKMTLKGTEKVGEQDTYVIEADPGDGSLRRLYFDVSSGLMLRSVIERDTETGRGAFELTLENYRDVDGIKLPFVVRAQSPGTSYVIRVSEVKHNVPIEDAKFSKPVTP
ncbi:MAG TPA: hypothetical protein VKE24_05780 [Candidatus Acidoferrales bacterium]|nr:hypothetical protein [Candidatus Acidoferrales bacterium]